MGIFKGVVIKIKKTIFRLFKKTPQKFRMFKQAPQDFLWELNLKIGFKKLACNSFPNSHKDLELEL